MFTKANMLPIMHTFSNHRSISSGCSLVRDIFLNKDILLAKFVLRVAKTHRERKFVQRLKFL